MSPPFELTAAPTGTVFRARVSPGASKAKFLGEHGGALKLSVNAPPEKGKANSALLKLLAKALGVQRNQLAIISGETRKTKRILLKDKDIDQTRKLLRKAARI